jgi:hypothetical protein
METGKKVIRYIIGCIGFIVGFLVIYYAFEEVTIPHVIHSPERPLFYTGIVICLVSIGLCLVTRKR